MSVANHNSAIDTEIANLRTWLVRIQDMKSKLHFTVSQKDHCETMVKTLFYKIERLEAMKINDE